MATQGNPASVVRIGQINQNGDVDALFLKVFAGEVITAFEETNVALPYTQTRSISSGKSAQFPATGRVSAEYHTVGAELLGLQMNSAENIIVIDDLLVSHGFLSNIDEAKVHYDYRSIFSTEMGRALATAMDKHILQIGVLAARATNKVTGLPGGTVITEATAGDFNDGVKLGAALFDAAQALDEKEAPEQDRVCFLRPKEYYSLAKATVNINKDWNGAGSYSDGKIFKVAGFDIVKTNHLPGKLIDITGAASVETGSQKTYGGDFSKTKALCMHKGAVGTVKLLDLGMESEYQVRRQGTLLVAKYACGHGVLNPALAVEIAGK